MFAIAIASAVEAQKSESNKKRASIAQAQAQVSTLIALACALTEKQNSQSSMICVCVLLKCNSNKANWREEQKKSAWPTFNFKGTDCTGCSIKNVYIRHLHTLQMFSIFSCLIKPMTALGNTLFISHLKTLSLPLPFIITK